MKNELCTFLGLVFGAVASYFGGWDAAIQTLIVLMAVDYITGLIVAGVFHTSPKTKTGTLESRAGWKGLCRKGTTLLVVLVACRLDAILGSSFVRDATVIAFSCNEAIYNNDKRPCFDSFRTHRTSSRHIFHRTAWW